MPRGRGGTKVRCSRCGIYTSGVDHEVCPRRREQGGANNPNWRNGATGHPLYDTYNDMIARCTRSTHSRYPSYGGRGIEVCARWRDSFESFVADMGERPDGHVLDRVDNDGHYEPANCRWTTYAESNRNRRPTHLNRVRDERGRFT